MRSCCWSTPSWRGRCNATWATSTRRPGLPLTTAAQDAFLWDSHFRPEDSDTGVMSYTGFPLMVLTRPWLGDGVNHDAGESDGDRISVFLLFEYRSRSLVIFVATRPACVQ